MVLINSPCVEMSVWNYLFYLIYSFMYFSNSFMYLIQYLCLLFELEMVLINCPCVDISVWNYLFYFISFYFIYSFMYFLSRLFIYLFIYV